MKPIFLGSHPAIDFLNTALAPDGQPIETIGDGRAWLDWLVGAGLLDKAQAAKLARRFGADALDESAAEARRIREWARGWLVRWRASPKAAYREEVAALNKLLARGTYSRHVTAAGGKLMVDELPRIETPGMLVALAAAALAALIAKEQPSLVRECAGSACTLWFLDRSKAHSRQFCSPAACGNRAKVAAFRGRQRG
jgi:predicted RNA-binding Zn ribbon-like protein